MNRFKRIFIKSIAITPALICFAIFVIGSTPAKGGEYFNARLFRADVTGAPPVAQREDLPALMDAIQVKVKTRGSRGSETAAGVYMSICDIVFELKNAKDAKDASLRDGDAEYFTLLFASPGEGDTVQFAAYPYGYLKYCDIKIWHGSEGREPGWFADYVRIYYHLASEGWFKEGVATGWRRYMSPAHFFEEKDRWTGDYTYPYQASEPRHLQYYGTNSAGNKWLALVNGSCPGCDLSYNDMRGADLSNGDFSGAGFTGANLSGVKFANAKLDGARFGGADLSGVDLSGRDFSGADMRKAKLHGTNLSGANLSGADLSFMDADRADFSGAVIQGADISHSAFFSCNFSGADLSGARIDWRNDKSSGRTDFSGSNFQNASLAKVDLTNAAFPGVDLRGANLSGAIVKNLRQFLQIRTDASTICPSGAKGPCDW